MRMRTVEISVGRFRARRHRLPLIFLVGQRSAASISPRAVILTSLQARFDDVAGLRVRAKVSMAGVTVGRVARIDVDMEYGEAIVALEIHGEPGNLSLDTGAQILTEGILGARYVSLLPGADEETLADGDFIEETQGALVLENLVGDLITRLGSS